MFNSFKEQLEFYTGQSTFRLSHSSRELFHGCKRKFEFRKLHPNSDREDNYDAMVGKALHAAHQNYLMFRDEDKAIWALIKNWDVTVESRKDYEPKTLEAAFATLMAIINHNQGLLEYELAQVTVNGEARPAIEVPFEIALKIGGVPFEIAPGVPVTYIGYVDDILVNFMTMEYMVEDLKTNRNLSINNKTPLYAYSEQPLPYAMVVAAALNQPINSLRMKYLDAYIDLRKPQITPYEFLKSSDLITDWARGLYLDLEDIKRHIAIKWWPRNANHCLSWNRPCVYFDICGSRDQDYIESIFELTKDPSFEGKDFQPWFKLDLELAA